MKKMGLKCKLRGKYKVTTDSSHKEPVAENILNREFKQTEPSKAWVSDITYIQVQEGFIYLTTLIDLFDRKVIGWSISEGMRAEETIIPALNMALRNRNPKKGTILHSDRGVQYASFKTRNLLAFHHMQQSMSRKGNCWDNAVAESFFKTLKAEMIYGNKLLSKEKMKMDVFEFIEIWYNRKRRHSALNHLTIEEFWSKHNQMNKNNSTVA
jgi:Transposase and inactivated derivatives